MVDEKLQYTVRHRKFLEDWSKVVVLTASFDEAKEVVVAIMNSSDIMAEVSVYDPLMGRTSYYYPDYKDGERVPANIGDIR